MSKSGLQRIHVDGTPAIHHAVQITEPYVFPAHPQCDQHFQARNAGSAAAGRDDPDISKRLVHDTQRIGSRRADNDRSAMLIVMKNRNLHPLAANPLDGKTIRSADILQVDRTKAGLKRADQVCQALGILLVQFEVEAIDIAKLLEQDRFTFHHRF